MNVNLQALASTYAGQYLLEFFLRTAAQMAHVWHVDRLALVKGALPSAGCIHFNCQTQETAALKALCSRVS